MALPENRRRGVRSFWRTIPETLSMAACLFMALAGKPFPMSPPDIFSPSPTETAADRKWRLELISIARMLSTRPFSRRAIRFDIPEACYLVEDRKTDKPLAVVGFQLISRDYRPGNDAPAFLALLETIRSLAERHNVAPIYLCAWQETHWGFAKIPTEADLQRAPDSDSIVLIPQKSFLAIYETTREKSIKIEP